PALIAAVGQRTGELHQALSQATGNPDFAPEPVIAADIEAWRASARAQAEQAFAALDRIQDGDEALAALLARREEAMTLLASHSPAPAGHKVRVHGDYHLGQILVAQRDVYIIDF